MKKLDLTLQWWPIIPDRGFRILSDIAVHVANVAPFEKDKIVKWLNRSIPADNYHIGRTTYSREYYEDLEFTLPSFTIVLADIHSRIAFEALLRRITIRPYSFVLPHGLDKNTRRNLRKAEAIKDSVWNITATHQRDETKRKIVSMTRNEHSNMAIAMMRLTRVI